MPNTVEVPDGTVAFIVLLSVRELSDRRVADSAETSSTELALAAPATE